MMVQRCFILVLIAIGASRPVPAQQQLFRSYTVSQGLPNNSIRNIYQDSKGFIWIGTWEGLSKYDGHRFMNFTEKNGLPHNMINDLYETSNGQIMVAMNDGSTNLVDHDRVITPSLFSGVVINNLFEEGKDQLLAVTDFLGFYKIDKNIIKKAAATEAYSMFNAIKTKQGFYVVTGSKYAVAVFDKNFKKIYDSERPDFIAEELLEDYSGRIWIASEEGLKLLSTKKGTTGQFELVSLKAPFDHPALRSGRVSAIYQDQDSSLWFGTDAGLLKIEPDGNQLLYTEKDGLPSPRIRYIMRDREKNLWVGTTAGLAKMPIQSVRVINLPNTRSGSTTLHGLYPLQGPFCMLITSDGVYSINTDNGDLKVLLNSSAVVVAQSDPLQLLVYTQLFEYDSSTNSLVFIQNIGNHEGYYCAAQKNNILAMGLGYGVRIYNKGKITSALDSLRIHTLLWDKFDRLWLGSWGSGLYRIQFDSVQNKIVKIENLTPQSTLHIRMLKEDRHGNMWVGTRYNGLVLFSPDAKGERSRMITREDGLLSNWIYCMGEAEDGTIWVGTLSGINKIIKEQNGYRVFNFSRVVNFFSIVSSIGFRDNQIWCASDKGLLQITDHKLENQHPLPVQFTRVQLGKNPDNYARTVLQHPIDLKYRHNFSAFEFTSTGFINESELLYSYRLVGSHDTSWTEPANIHSVQYASLQPGHYRFEVRMLGWDGTYGQTNQFTFNIASPYWQTWWFYLGLFLIAVTIFYSVYRYRVKQLVKIQHVRNNIATDLHDDIGSTLTNISILSQLSMNNLHKPKQAESFMSRIRDEVDTSSQALDDIIWSVNTRNDSLRETLARMRRFAGDLFDNSATQCSLEIEENASDKKINMEQRRDLYLIYKESLANIHKHAKASHVSIRVSLAHNMFTLEIEDDGKGFQPEQDTHRNGIKNLKHRVEKWNGKLKLVSGKNQGTKITMNMPVKEI